MMLNVVNINDMLVQYSKARNEVLSVLCVLNVIKVYSVDFDVLVLNIFCTVFLTPF